MQTIIAVYVKNKVTNKRAYPWSSIVQVFINGIMDVCCPLFIYYFVLQKNLSSVFVYYTNTSDYLSYVILGESIYIIAFSTLMNVGRCMISEIREGTLDSFLLSPASRGGYFIGAYLEQLYRSIMAFILIILLGMILGMRIPIKKIFLLIELIILASVSCLSMAIVLSTIMVFTRDTYLVQNTIMLLLGIVSGIFYPIEMLPTILRYLGLIIPTTYAVDIFRCCILTNSNITDNIDKIEIMLILCVIYAVSGYIGLRIIEKKLVEEIFS